MRRSSFIARLVGAVAAAAIAIRAQEPVVTKVFEPKDYVGEWVFVRPYKYDVDSELLKESPRGYFRFQYRNVDPS